MLSIHSPATPSSMLTAKSVFMMNDDAARQNSRATMRDPILENSALPAPSETTTIRVDSALAVSSTQAAASSHSRPACIWDLPIQHAPAQRPPRRVIRQPPIHWVLLGSARGVHHLE